MSLLDDIDHDYHANLLEFGNLQRRKPEVSWSDANSWKTLGHTARILQTRCLCGNITNTLIGIFRTERTPSGNQRDTRVDFRPQTCRKVVEVQSTPICPACL